MATTCPKCNSENPLDSKFCKECGTQLTSAETPDESITRTLEIPVEDLPRGTLFAGRYEIIESLGTGGMGKVYKAYDKQLKEEVALKLIKPEIASDRKTLGRFSNELKIARKIVHKNVGRMYELMEDGGAFFITMEYVSGQDLKGLIRQSRQLTSGTAISITKQICEGLIEAHGLGVVHRDLKPSNIMIDKQGNARIMDFGLARSLKEEGITRRGTMIGTPHYMSPEQVEGDDIDQRSDIYSMGVILYEMLTGTVPFEGDTALSIAHKHKYEAPQDPKKINAQIPDDLSHLILKCLEKDKEKRCQSAGELLAELGDIEKGIPSTAGEIPKRKVFTPRKLIITLGLKKLLITTIIVLGLAVITFIIFRKPGPDLDPNRIVVAIFDNQTGDPGNDVIGRMAADWLTQGLAHTGLVDIVPSMSVERIYIGYEGGDPIRFLAQETNAGTVVTGTYYLQGDIIQFHTQVTDARKGKLLKALDPVSGPFEDLSKLIESLRQQLMITLAIFFEPALKDRAKFMYMPPSYEAYKEYMEGSKLFKRGEWKQAIDYLFRAATLDPAFARPRIYAALSYANLGEFAKADALIKEVDKLSEKLILFDRYLLDWIKAILRGDHYGAYRAAVQSARLTSLPFEKVVVAVNAVKINRPQEAADLLSQVNPERPMFKGFSYYWYLLTTAHHMLGNNKKELKEARRGRKQYPDNLAVLYCEIRALAALGKIKEVNECLDESLNLPPGLGVYPDWIMLWTGRELRAHGYREASLQVLERGIRGLESRPKEETETRAHRGSLAEVLYTAERWEVAQVLFKDLHNEHPDNINYLGYLGTLAARKGDRDEALKISGLLENDERPYLFGSHTIWRARIAALLGEKELAVRLLQEALAQGVYYQPLLVRDWIQPNMDFEPLYDYPPFQELIKPKG